MIDKATESVLEKCTINDWQLHRDKILPAVYEHVLRTMSYNPDAVAKIYQEVLGLRPGTKISLNEYIKADIGASRQQALYAGSIIERIIQLGYLPGSSVSIRRNKSGVVRGGYDSRSWVWYEAANGDVTILDVSRHVLDSLENLERQRGYDASRQNYTL